MLKNKPKNKHGFTLTELIIVIVIIGILAAVLIPTLTNYVNRAKLSNDKSNARNINMILSVESLEDNVAYYDADQVIQIAFNNGYDLKASAKGYNFCYDYNKNMVVVKSDSELGLQADDNHQILNNPINKLRQISSGLLYIEQGSNSISNVVNTMANFLDVVLDTPLLSGETTIGEVMIRVFEETTKDLSPILKAHFASFDPRNTVYVNRSGIYTAAIKSTGNIKFTYSEGSTTITKEVLTEVVGYDENNQNQGLTNIIISPDETNLPDFYNTLLLVSNTADIYIPRFVEADTSYVKFINALKPSDQLIIDGSKLKFDAVDENYNPTTKIILTVSNHQQAQVLEDNGVKHVKPTVLSPIGHSVNLKTITFIYTEVINTKNDGILYLDKSIPIKVELEGILIEGCSINAKSIINERGNRVYDIMVFDRNGVLYARGVLEYRFDNTASESSSDQN